MEEARVLKLVILTSLPHYLSKRAWYLNKPGIIKLFFFFFERDPCFSNFSIHQNFPCRSSEGPIPEDSDRAYPGCGPQICIFNKFLGDAAVGSLMVTLQERRI